MCRPALRTRSFRCRQYVRIVRISCEGRKEFRNSPYVCSFISHWLSCTSLLRPGRFFVSRAFTRYTSKPACSRMSYTAIQYTPVDCIATVRIRHCFSHPAIAFSSAVVLAEASHRFGIARRWYGRVVGFITYINAGGIGMHHFQAEVIALDPPHHLSSLLAVHLVPMALCWAAGCFLGFLLWLRFHASPPMFKWRDVVPLWLHLDGSIRGLAATMGLC